MTLTAQQQELWNSQGFLAYDEPLLSPEELEAIGKRIAELASGARPDLPAEVFSVERAVTAGAVKDVDDYDRYRVMRWLHKYDDLVLAACRSPKVLDVVEDLMGPNVKLYTDQVFMKPPFHGGEQGWHQDSSTWRFFASHDHVTCWIAIDEATEENGCLRYLPGTHKCGFVDRERVPVLVEQLRDTAVPVPRRPGYGVFHHALTLHSSGPNTTPHRRRGLVLHYVNAETRYIGLPTDRKGPFLLMRGQEFPGRV
jgi:ectoine hydroxylase-related dioxygenase (phytanoyl-CoA dioxygenase family)